MTDNNVTKKQTIFSIALLILSIIFLTLLSQYPEPQVITYNRAIDRNTIQLVELNCVLNEAGIKSKTLFCTETILMEETK